MRTYHITFTINKRREYLAFIARSRERALDALRCIYSGKLVVLWVKIDY
jgi:hypothetical protein